MIRHCHVLTAAALIVGCPAIATAQPAAPIVDPLTVRIDDSDARRFAALWKASRGTPTAPQVQAQYLDKGGRAIEVFTLGRIGNAEQLARKIAANPTLYRDAVERCLPWVEGTNAQLRSVYLGLKGLLPNRRLPVIAVVVGANNSGGTAAEAIQVIGLEVICRLSPTRAKFEDHMRAFFAHETVHTLQADTPPPDRAKILLAAALNEGVADYVTSLVTGTVPDAARHEWACARETWIWQQFHADAAIVGGDADTKGELGKRGQAAFRRWFGNAGSGPLGWPDELGYWVGMRIAQSYVAASADPHVAIGQLLSPTDPASILAKSGYGTINALNRRWPSQ